MKKIILLICFILILPVASNTCHAKTKFDYNIEFLGDSKKDLKKIKALNDEIIANINEIATIENKETLPDDFAIDFSSAIKIYSGEGLFSVNNSKKNVLNNLNKNEYIWDLDIYNGDDIYNVRFEKGKGVSEKIENSGLLSDFEIKELKDNKGKWTINSYAYYDSESIILSERINSIISNMNYDMKHSRVIICDSLPHIHYPVALIMDKHYVKYLIPVYTFNVEGTEEQLNSVKATEVDSSGNVYIYDAIKNASNEMPVENENVTGGSGIVLSSVYTAPVMEDNDVYFSPKLIFFCVLSLITLCFIILFIIKHRKRNTKPAMQ